MGRKKCRQRRGRKVNKRKGNKGTKRYIEERIK